jgi:AsmA-like C-terminal region/AsmA family
MLQRCTKFAGETSPKTVDGVICLMIDLATYFNMKKILIWIGFILLFLVVGLLAAPFLFKDQVKAKISQVIEKQVNAHVFYGDFDLSFWRNFPSMTVALHQFGVANRSPFVGDTLLQAKRLEVSINLKSLLKGRYQVHKIGLVQPKVSIKVLKNGQTNYDIYSAQRTDTATDSSKAKFNVLISDWKLEDGYLRYDDQLRGTEVVLQNINHEGSGDFSEQLFDLEAQTRIDSVSVRHGGQLYLNKQSIENELMLGIDQESNTYTLKDNSLKINEFLLEWEGWIQQPDTQTIRMDLKYRSPQTDFKQLLSLVPSWRGSQFDDLTAEGNLAFDGFFKGQYTPETMPQFGLHLLVNDGRFQFPKLAVPVSGVQVDLHVRNPSTQLEGLVVDLQKGIANLGSNPLNVKFLSTGFATKKIDLKALAKIDLGQITQIFPLPNLNLRGAYQLNMTAKGLLDSLHFPVVNALMQLKNGYVKSDKIPEPIEQLEVLARVTNASGLAADTQIALENLQMALAGEKFQAKGTILGVQEAQWDMLANGVLDLSKITRIYPLNDMTLQGKIRADIRTQGNMKALKTKQYGALPTSGTAELSNFAFESKAYPQGMKILKGKIKFTPQQLVVEEAVGFLGTSDFSAAGQVSNYLGYALNNEALKGTFDIKSKQFNANEWLTDKPKEVAKTQALQVVEIPQNIDMKLNATVDEALYEKMKIKNGEGTLLISQGKILMQDVAFQSLGGRFVTSGTYDPSDLAHPKFDFSLNLSNIQIPEAYRHSKVVQTLVPLAAYFIGEISTKFNLSGELQQDMMPALQTLVGSGAVKILRAVVSGDNNVVARLAEVTKIKALQNLQIKDALMQANIQEGKLLVKPFDVRFEDYRLNVGGFNALDGRLEYDLKMDVPTGKAGQAFGAAFTNWTGKNLGNTDRVKFDLRLSGTYKNPTISFDGSSTARGLKDALKTEIEEAKIKAAEEAAKLKQQAEGEVNRLKQEAEKRLNDEKERLLQEAENKKIELENRANAEKERLLREAETKAKALADSLKKAAGERAKKELEKRKNAILDGLLKKKTAPPDTTRRERR